MRGYKKRGIVRYVDESGETVHPIVAQLAETFGRSDLAYILDEQGSLLFYRGIAAYAANCAESSLWARSWTLAFLVDNAFREHYEKLLLSTFNTRCEWVEMPEPPLYCSFLSGIAIPLFLDAHETGLFREDFVKSVTVSVPLTMEDEKGSSRTKRLLLFLCGPAQVALWLANQVCLAESQWWDGYGKALNEHVRQPFEFASLLRNYGRGRVGNPSGWGLLPVTPSAVFDYLGALDEVQRTTGITSLRELEAQVTPPRLDGGVW